MSMAGLTRLPVMPTGPTRRSWDGTGPTASRGNPRAQAAPVAAMSVPWWSWVPCGSPFDALGPLGLDLEGDFEMAASLLLSIPVRPAARERSPDGRLRPLRRLREGAIVRVNNDPDARVSC